MSVDVEHAKQWDWPLTPDDFITVVDDATHFEVDLDVKSFKKEEVKVETIEDLVNIHLDHEAKDDDPMNVSRNIIRRV
ncbi:hypothetical protein OESDEN_04126 [Oesophagostomum dentatum]|uniref:SHSP domain-containing protein n=1 Tax=Oesophagostomum dentatum TaxID=61180 RepID=A0A0B1TF70_OESDE|nr:hypothetical protein OESDEN_04126 [Oesophagostomum dentatum]